MSSDKRVPWQLGRIYSDEVKAVVWGKDEAEARLAASSWAADSSYVDPESTWCRPHRGAEPPPQP